MASSSSSAAARKSGAGAALGGAPGAGGAPRSSNSAAANQPGPRDSNNENDINATDGASDLITNGMSVALLVRSKSVSLFEVGVAVFNSKDQTLEITSLEDSNMWPNVESLLLQLSPEVLVLNALDPKMPKQAKSRLRKLVNEALDEVEQLGEAGVEKAGGCFGKEQEVRSAVCEKLLLPETVASAKLDLLESSLEMQALGGLIDHLDLKNDGDAYQQCVLQRFAGIQTHMRLDKAAFNALHIFPLEKSDNRTPTNVLGYLNKGRTPMGFRKLQSWLRQPLMDRAEIERRHSLLSALVDDEEGGMALQRVQSCLRNLKDLELIARKLQKTAQFRKEQEENEKSAGIGKNAKAPATAPYPRGGAELSDLYDVWRAIQSCVELNDHLERATAPDGPLQTYFRKPMENCLRKFAGFVQLVETTLDMEKAQASSGREILVNRSFDPSFAALDEEKKALVKKMEGVLEATKKDVQKFDGKCDVKLIEYSNERDKDNEFTRVMRVNKKGHGSVMKANDKSEKYEQVVLKKAEFCFTTAALKTYCKAYAKKEEDYLKSQTGLAAKCCAIGATYCGLLERLSNILAEIDVVAAFALVCQCSTKTTWVRPKISEDSEENGGQRELYLKEATHPIVQETSDTQFTANDCRMTSSKGRFMTITGPNMGGKSTFIRQIALCAFLNQIGMFVPAQEATLPLFSSIYARVGASDAQLKGISTFMAEMVEASTILRQADSRSLVLVDELGRGTSTQDGYGLAYSIAKYLIKTVQCFTLFATHFHELGELSEEIGEKVQNRHAEAQVAENGELAFLYNLREGLAEKSYGVHVARVAQFPDEAISSAKRTADFLESRAAKKARGAGHGAGGAAAGAGGANPSAGVDKILSAFGCSGALELAKRLVKGEISREKFLGNLKTIDFADSSAMEVDG